MDIKLAQILSKHEELPDEYKEKLLEARNLLDKVFSVIKTQTDLLLNENPTRFEKVDLAQVLDTALAFSAPYDVEPTNKKWSKTAETSQKCRQHSKYSQFFGNTEITLTLPAKEVHVRGNEILLVQAFSNIFSNAFKILSEKGSTTKKNIQVEVIESGTTFLTKITDTGPGLKGDRPEEIFENLFSSSSTGMGLGITKNIISRHQGRLFIDPNETYTTFCIELWRYENYPAP